MTSRKKSRTWINSEENPKEADELLVFGYSCKVFRDEEKASYIDEGKHLIPWMGDKSLLIDRYDGRGYLHNLQEFEPVDEKDASEIALSEEDYHLEQLCDEERYMALQKNLTEEELYHEEEIKRLRAALIDEGAYNQVGFSYEEQQMASNGQKEENEAETEEQMDEDSGAFVPRVELNVPQGMEVPPTAKVNAIIEKTAMFVSRQGPQMEIVIKAKQSNNAQFSFLAFDHSLNPYYKHMVQAIKSGKYVPRPQSNSSDEDNDSDDDHYLHPSLQASQAPQVLNVPKIAYAWTGKDSYSLLVSQLKDKVYSGLQEIQDGARAVDSPSPPKPMSVEPSPPPPPPGIAPVTLPQISQPGFDNADAAFPPADLLPIVDKMASYVAKNGIDFEAIVKSKGADDRFEFLKPGHRFYTYYQFKRKMYEKQIQLEREKNLTNASGDKENTSDDKEAKTDKVVSFSIKMKESGEKRNALVMVENEEGQNGATSPEKSEPATESLLEKKENEEDEDPANKVKVQSQEAKLAEERIRDRLAAAARERLVQVSREKQLQMERKRKAALFLTLLHKGKEEDANLIGPRLPNAAELEILVDTEAELPLIPSFMTAGTPSIFAHCPTPFMPALIMDPVTAAIQDKTVDALIRSHVSNSMRRSPSPKVVRPSLHHHRHKGHHRERSRSRSRSRSKHKAKRRSKSRSRSRSRGRKSGGGGGSRKKSRKSRSRSRERRRRRGDRRSSKERDEKTDRRKSSRTPPAAYSSPRKSGSPKRKSERSKTKTKSQRERRSRSASRSPSASRRKDARRSSTLKQTRKATSSRSRSRSRRRSPGSSRSPSKSRDAKR